MTLSTRFAVVFVLAVSACRTIPMPEFPPIPTSLTQEETRAAITRALCLRKWSVVDESPGEIMATVRSRQTAVHLRITYDETSVRTLYHDSVNMSCSQRGPSCSRIHKRYRLWVEKLRSELAIALLQDPGLAIQAIPPRCRPDAELTVARTDRRPARVDHLASRRVRKLIVLAPAEQRCPNRCSGLDREARAWVSLLEGMLAERGYGAVSGAVVARVERELAASRVRETWDRVEKAILLGERTGADAILEVRSLFVDEFDRSYVLDESALRFIFAGDNAFGRERVGPRDQLRRTIPVWRAVVELRLVHVDGTVLWSGSESVETTDLLSSDWTVRVPLAARRVVLDAAVSPGGPDSSEYFSLYHDPAVRSAALVSSMRDLVEAMPRP